MAYLSDCEWDIFVSYAHDDKPKVGPAANWIVKFVEGLAVELNRYTGVHFDIYFDQNAQRFNEEIEGILTKVRRSAVFLMIGSPNFIQSNWCRNEIRTFREGKDDTSTIFIAEIMGLRDRDYPVEVPNNLQARFWEKENGVPMTLTHNEKKYRLLLAQMATQICGKLEELKKAEEERGPARAQGGGNGPAGLPAPGAEPVPGRVLVGWARDDEDRKQLISYLDGIGVSAVDLPQGPPEQRPELDSALEAALGEAAVYVQLLDRRPISAPAGAESPTYVQLEAARARLGADDIFLWRPDDLDPEKNDDEKYRDLLRHAENPTIAELARAVRDRMAAKSVAPPAGSEEPLVLVINADPEDREFADELMDACDGRELTAILDDFAQEDSDRVGWADASAVAFVQGKVPRSWLTARCIVFNRVLAGRRSAATSKGQVILYAPPGPKAQVRIGGMTRFDQIDVSNQWSTAPFEQWLDKIGARRIGG